jgi:hypothetical protein
MPIAEGLGERMSQTRTPRYPEGPMARAIEEETIKIPSDWFLWAAGASIVGSLTLHCAGRKNDGAFVAQWVPTILILGLYNKLVKVAGSDRAS